MLYNKFALKLKKKFYKYIIFRDYSNKIKT